jgi:outer membrane protein assembly factor BamB
MVLDADKGAIRWKKASMPGVGAAGSRAQRPLIQFDEEQGMIYVLSISGATAFKFDGTEIWNTRLETAAVTPAFDEGLLYSGGRDWILYAYKAEAREDPPPRASLPAPGRYGLGLGPPRREWTDFSERYDFEYEALLGQMEASIRSGAMGEEEPLIARSLIGILSDKRTIQTERIMAARLLGLIGSTEIVPVLARRLLAESDGSVQTELALSLGRIGVDPQGRVLDVFQRLIERQRPAIQNEPLFLAIASALGNMCRFSGPPVSERGVRLLVTLANENSSSAVHEKARRELESLR